MVMDVPGLCSECKRPRVLVSCSLCGALVCGECVRGRHSCARLGPSVLRGAWGTDDPEPAASDVKK